MHNSFTKSGDISIGYVSMTKVRQLMGQHENPRTTHLIQLLSLSGTLQTLSQSRCVLLQVIHQPHLKKHLRPQSIKNIPGGFDLTYWRSFSSRPSMCISDLVRPPLGLQCSLSLLFFFKWTLDSVALVGPLVMIQSAPVMSPTSHKTHKSLQRAAPLTFS